VLAWNRLTRSPLRRATTETLLTKDLTMGYPRNIQTKRTTLATVTDEQIKQLRHEAYMASDDDMVLTCDIALGWADGDSDVARRDCVEFIRNGEP
jgi:hypothetical protein